MTTHDNGPTLPDERLRAIEWARSFLVSLMLPSQMKRVPKEVRLEARSILKHFPTPYEIEQLSTHSLLGGAVRNGDEQSHLNMNLDSYKQYVRIKLVKEGLYNVHFADTHVFLGNFRYREVSNLYTYEPPEYWDYTGDWDEDTLIAIGLHLKDLNLQCANKAKETRTYD